MKVEKQIQKGKTLFKNLLSKSIEYFKSKKPEFKPESMLKFTLIFVALIFVNVTGTSPGVDAAQTSSNNTSSYVYSVKNRAKSNLIREVKDFMFEIAPETTLDPEYLIDKCLEYEMDIVFVLAQGILESHLGTKGKASQTNSVWNVGTYDDGRILYKYDTANESIEPYLKLLKNRYLVDKDIHQLVTEKYTNDKGKRFASARNYENGMRKLMVRIDMETNISLHQEILELNDEDLLAYFAPFQQLDNTNILAFN